MIGGTHGRILHVDLTSGTTRVEQPDEDFYRLLEAKKYATFLKYFFPPADLKEALQTASFEEIVEEFVEEKADRVLSMLKSLKHKRPTFSADGKKATYPISMRGSTIKTVTFVKLGKYWYIQN